MRYLLFFAVPLALAAQSAESDQRITQVLISEIQQLRLAIERSTLLGARTQLAISQLQMQESTVARVSSQYDDMRTKRNAIARQRSGLVERIKELENRRSTVNINPTEREALGRAIPNMKQEFEDLAAAEQQTTAREGEVAG